MPESETAISAAEARYRAGDYAGAVGLLAPLIDNGPPDPTVLRVMGLCRLRQGASAEALELLSRANALAPGDPWTRLHLGIGLHTVGRHADAATLFRSCLADLPMDPAPHLNLAASLLALGEARAAVQAARKARRRAPDMAQTHYLLGLAQLACGELEPAAKSFRQAVRLAPRFAEAWVNLGVARYRAGAIEDAKQAMRTALAIEPDHRAAVANLGGMLRLTGELEAGEALLRGLLNRDAGAVEARLNLAAGLLQEDQTAEALDLLKGEVPGDPTTRAHWLLQRSLALIKLGRSAEARGVLGMLGEVGQAMAPLLGWRRVLLAEAEGDAIGARREAARMQEALETGSGTLPEHRIMGHYDLARFWSALGEHDQAFSHWVIGHRLLARFQPFSRAGFHSFVEASIAHFDAGRLASGARATNRDQTPVFVVGMPRSGTTLIEQIVAAHRDVFGAGERTALGKVFADLGGASESDVAAARIAALDAPALDAAAAGYVDELRALAPGAGRIIDKMPGNYRYLGLVALMLPGARVIHCDRDPRDIGLSIFTYRFYGSHGYAHDLSDLGWYIGQHRRLMLHWRAVLPNPMMTVQLRDWVEDFAGTLRRVLDFLDLPYDPACERFHELQRRVRTVSRTQVREPINARGLGRWRTYERHLAPLIDSLHESGALAGDANPSGFAVQERLP
jgi:Flp pilus assembly protein TadD